MSTKKAASPIKIIESSDDDEVKPKEKEAEDEAAEEEEEDDAEIPAKRGRGRKPSVVIKYTEIKKAAAPKVLIEKKPRGRGRPPKRQHFSKRVVIAAPQSDDGSDENDNV